MADDAGSYWEKTSINVVSNVVRTIITALVGIVLVPYYLDTLGVGTYALIPLATTVTSYIMIVTDSIVSACSRYVVLSFQRNGMEDAQRTFNSAFFGILRIVLLVMPLALAFSWISPYVFGIPDINATEVQVMFGLIFMSSLVVTAASAFDTVFVAHNKLYCIYSSRTIYTLLQVLLIVLMFTVTVPSVVYIGVAYLVSAFVLVTIEYVLVKRTCPALRIRYRDYRSDKFKQMYSLGAWNIVQNLGSLLFIQMSLVITNLTLGAEVQGGFSIVVSFISMVNTACYAVSTSMGPLLFKEFSDGNDEGLIRIVTLALKFMSILFAMPIAFVLIYSPEILETWVGSEYRYLSETIFIAFLAQLLYCTYTLIGDLPEIHLTVNRIGMVTLMFGLINVVLALVLVKCLDMGTTGVILSWAVSITVLTVFKFVFNSYNSGAGYYAFLMPVVKGYAIMAVCTIALHFLSSVYRPMPGWTTLLLFFFAMFVVFAVAMFLLLFSNDEKRLISNTLPESVRARLPSFIVGRE